MRYIAKFSQLKGNAMFGEFNRQSGPSPEEANWEGWTPPWMSREGRGPRGPFGFGRGFGGPGRWQGPRGPFGHGHGFGGPWQGRHGGPGPNWGPPEGIFAVRAAAAGAPRRF